jgi:hypothetical protein
MGSGGGGGGEGGEGDLNVRGRGRRQGGGKNSFLCWFRFFIRLNGTKNEHKSFFVRLQHFWKKMSRASFFSGLSKKDRGIKGRSFCPPLLTLQHMSPLAFYVIMKF